MKRQKQTTQDASNQHAQAPIQF